MINLTIDGQTVEVPAGLTVLEACRQAGVHIPTLCDHPSLKPYGGCRLCVVEVEGMRTLQASCTLPASAGMVVRTNTPQVIQARKFVLDMLFSERNHFCMYCQKSGGDCDLQNAAYELDMTHWLIQPGWDAYSVDASHPYYVFDHNRCILCRRCVRACGELVGNFTLNLENRGASTIVIADTGLPLGESSCIRCGTCVQICPTGALIDRNSAYLGLDKDLQHIESVCTECSVGCAIDVAVRDNHIVRIDGVWDSPISEGLLCEQGRYLALKSEAERITAPMVRKNGALEPVSWDEALQTVAERFSALNGGIAALASTRLTAEALYAFKSLFSDHLQSSLVTTIEENFTAVPTQAGYPAGTLEDLKQADCVFVAGADLSASHQVAGFFFKRNLPEPTQLIVAAPEKTRLAERASFDLRLNPGSDETLFWGLVRLVQELGGSQAEVPAGIDLSYYTPEMVSEATGIPAETLTAAASLLTSAGHPVFVFGKGLIRQDSPAAHQALFALAKLVHGRLVSVRGKANSYTAQAYGLTRAFLPNGQQAAYLALGDEQPTERICERVKDIPFVVVQASYRSALTDAADVVLPVEMWAEQAGHFANLEGRLQEAHPALVPGGGIRSNQAVLQDLASRLGAQLDDGWQQSLLSNMGVLAS